jgi:outer membrane lipoprotein carrier protein
MIDANRPPSAARHPWARPLRAALFAAMGAAISLNAQADAVDSLKAFAKDVHAARAPFTQTVTAPDGVKKKNSSGQFEFARPNRFRFEYTKPFPQLIVGDGVKVWLHDQDLQQVTVRALDKAMGATPAALLAGQGLEKDFELRAEPTVDGVEWLTAKPREKEGASFESMRVGFKGKTLVAVEILDGFGQRTLMQFGEMVINHAPSNERFTFKPPAGVDVLQQ